jgi:hypothetical protein
MKVALINQSTAVTTDQLTAIIPDLQSQVSQDFAPVWGRDVNLYVATPQTVIAGDWTLYLKDTTDVPGEGGYHQLDASGVPTAFAFVKNSTIPWTVVVSHELLEMLADPYIDSSTFYMEQNNQELMVIVEVCDPCQANTYKKGDILVSDFVTPKWFIPGATGPFDYLNVIQNSLTLARGGYISYQQVTTSGWQQIHA